jgi:hypothetical protein
MTTSLIKRLRQLKDSKRPCYAQVKLATKPRLKVLKPAQLTMQFLPVNISLGQWLSCQLMRCIGWKEKVVVWKSFLNWPIFRA